MQKKWCIYRLTLLLICLLAAGIGYADDMPYLCEFGVQGGTGYYVGDATKHIFNNVSYAAGVQFRYKFTPRWAMQVKGQFQDIRFPMPDSNGDPMTGQQRKELGRNEIVNVDVVGEFNFFRLGQKQYDSRIKPITPYIFLGVGMGLYNDYRNVGVYFPFGFGLKWKFAPRWGLNLQWQHQLFFADNVENEPLYNNTYELNGSNILNNDLTSTLTLGIVFEFAKQKNACRSCQW